MPYWTHFDIISELADLCFDQCETIRHQLIYYRASVYKKETAQQIKQKIHELKGVVNLFGQEHIDDLFLDFEASLMVSHRPTGNGESYFASCVNTLTTSLVQNIKQHLRHINSATKSRDLTKRIGKQRRKILKLCQQGSRQWDFFQSI